MSAVFARSGELLVPTDHARGPWDADSQHGGAPAAAIARAVERLESNGPMLLARLTVEFLAAVPLAPLAIEARIVRPGRRLALAEATVAAEGRIVCRARAVRLRREPVAVPPSALRGPRLAPPDQLPRADLPLPPHGATDGFGLTGMELRFATGRFGEPGPATAWFRLRMPLVEGEAPTAAQRAVAAADFANGVAAELRFATHRFVNTDLSVHLAREPVGEWIGVEAVTEHGPEGTALAASVLHDLRGPVGRGAQSLYVSPR